MGEVICKKCGGKFERNAINSFGLCSACDDSNWQEIKRLRLFKRVWGVIAAATFCLLLGFFIIPLMGARDSAGHYLIRSNHGRDVIPVTFEGLLVGAFVIVIAGTGFSCVYLYFRRRVAL